MVIKLIFVFFIIVHGFAHLVGFVVPWKIASLQEMPFKTTLFYDKLNLGNKGIKIVGILWLLSALGFFFAAIFILMDNPIGLLIVSVSICFSIFLCISGLPDSKIGVFANFFILLLIFATKWFDWLILD